MNGIPIPSPDTIPVAWGWFQFLLLLTFPLHLLAMNAMLGGLGIAVVQHITGGETGRKLAHRIAVALPLVIAFVVNLGVAPLLFLQVLYGQFVYTSSVLIGILWIMVIPILIIAYYGAYLYDFKFKSLGNLGPWIGLAVFILLLVIGMAFSGNMLLMIQPERFNGYFANMSGTLAISDSSQFLPRYLHMMIGALAVGGLFVAILGKFSFAEDIGIADRAIAVGMKIFSWMTLANVVIGSWYLISLERQTMLLFMGKDTVATACFIVSLILTIGVIVAAFRGKLLVTVLHLVPLVYLMSFIRAWVRSDYLREFFTLSQLEVVPEYSPLVFFVVTLVAGIICVAWMLKLTLHALRERKSNRASA